ncbi:MAG TPA: GTP-binding protein [Pseudomonadales bacterium]|nr:GTP-binding protein [Pseudomonadales bacterium]
MTCAPTNNDNEKGVAVADSGLAHENPNTQRLPVTVRVGFPGAGRATVHNHLLGQSSQIAVLINEFGARRIDQSLLRACAGELVVPTACLEQALQAFVAIAAGDRA